MSRDHHDALMDQLLREILGGDRPRDLTARVLAQAKIYDRFRRRWWVSAASALAASIVLTASLIMFWPQKYPEIVVEGVTNMNGGNVERGSLIQSDDTNGGTLKLGNYVNIRMEPQTALTLGGGKYQEKVFLEQGELQVSVQKNKGRFDIAVGPATVHVTGTTFGVNVINDETATAQQKKLLVHVDEGSVEVQGIPGQTGTEYLSAGQQKEFVILYTPKVIPPINLALRAGLLAAAQEGARMGNRSGVLGARGLLVQPPAQTRGNRPMQLILNSGTGVIYGVLRRDHDLYYLETRPANIFMFPQTAIPNPGWPLPVGKSVRVVWTEGKVTGLNP